MTGFDLTDNFLSNLEKLVGKKRHSSLHPLLRHRQTNQSPLHQPYFSRWPRLSVTTPLPLLPTCPLGPLSMLGMTTSRSVLASSRWCRQVSSVACQAKMPTLTFSTSLSCATLSSSKTSHKTASGSVCFLSPSWERQNSGSTRTRKL